MAMKAKLRRMVIEPGAGDGEAFNGASVHHEYPPKPSKSGAFMSHEVEKPHVFGASEGPELISHIAEHLGIEPAGKEEHDEENVEG